LDPLGRHLAERAAEGAPRGGGSLDVVGDAAKLELAVLPPQRVGAAGVAVERHAHAAGVQELRSVRPGSAELEMAVPEDDRTIANARQHALLAWLRLRREALDVRQRRPVDIEDAVEVDLRLQRGEPALVGAHA